MPCCTTCCGKRGSTCLRRFWMSTSARSGLVPGAKVASISRLPTLSLVGSEHRLLAGAIDLPSDDAAEIGTDRFGGGPGVGGADHEGGGRRTRIPRHGRLGKGKRARHDNGERNNPCENRAVDEEKWHA